MANEDDEKTRLIRRTAPADSAAEPSTRPAPKPESEPATEPNFQHARVLEPEADEGAHTRLAGPARRAGAAETAGSSVAGDGGELDPVVGWLVILAGPGRGNARRLGYGQNSIGRDKTERVSLDFGDASISRSKHCFVLYEPRKRQYLVRPGDGSNLTYLNGDLLAEARPLAAADVLEIGATQMKFVPFCGAEFDWENAALPPK